MGLLGIGKDTKSQVSCSSRVAAYVNENESSGNIHQGRDSGETLCHKF